MILPWDYNELAVHVHWVAVSMRGRAMAVQWAPSGYTVVCVGMQRAALRPISRATTDA